MPTVLNLIKNILVTYRYIKPLQRKLHNERHHHNKSNTIALFANPRSGSTWLTKLLHEIPKSLVIDEPLWRGNYRTDRTHVDSNMGKLKAVEELNFYFNQPISVQASWPEAELFFEELLDLKILHPEILNETSLEGLGEAETFLFKFNYANLMMPWIVNKFDIKALLLVRHPCAVVASQLEHHAFREVLDCDSFKIPQCPFNDIFLKYEQQLSSLQTPEEILAATWALNFLNTVGHPGNDEHWITTTYEKLVLNPEGELERILRRLDIAAPRSIDKEFQNHDYGPGQLSKWKSSLTKLQQKRVLDVIDSFGITAYSDKEEPDYSQLILF